MRNYKRIMAFIIAVIILLSSNSVLLFCVSASNLENLLLDHPVTTSNEEVFYTNNYPVARLTDGSKSATSPCAIIAYNKLIGYYQTEFAELQTFNKVVLYFSQDETNIRPKDIALDVLQENGIWMRAAELHNIVYNAIQPLEITFPQIAGKKLRITANAKRIREEKPNTVLNFRLTEAEAYDDPTVTEYTGVQADENEAYNIDLPDPELNNLLLGLPVTTSNIEAFYTNNFPVERLTDGSKSINSSCAIIGYNSKSIGYYQTEFASLQAVNRVVLYFSKDETNLRPKDLAVDVLQENGVWMRAAELHNIVYDGTQPLRITFPAVNAKKLRITANAKRIREEKPNTILNFRLTEAEAFYDPTVTEYTGAEADENKAYNMDVPDPELENLLLDLPVSTSNIDDFYTNNFPVERLTDGNRNVNSPCAIIGYNSKFIGYYQTEFASLQAVNRVMLYFSQDETNLRPKDLAVDVLQENGVWKRVAELHNIVYDATEPLRITFPGINGKKLRITANAKRLSEEKPNTVLNFRLTEAEAFYDPTVTEYTGTEADENKPYNMDVPDPELENLLLDLPVSTSNIDDFYTNNFPAERLTDGNKTVVSPCAIIGYNDKLIGYYQMGFASLQAVNRVMLYFSQDETNLRPKDLAVDVLQENGVWKRVAELHDIEYDATEPLRITFPEIEGKKLRITANAKRVSEENPNTILNFRLTEAEAFYDPSVTEYTGAKADKEKAYNIQLPDPELKNLLWKLPVSTSNIDSFYTDNYPASRLTDGSKTVVSPCAIIGYSNKLIGYYETEFKKLQKLNRVMLYFSKDETNLRPKDLAVDVLQKNGIWKRVAELHNIAYDATEPLRITFPEIEGKKLRITANAKRVSEENPNTILNFRLTEAEAFYDPSVTEYTGVKSDKNTAYQIELPDPELKNLLWKLPVATSNIDSFYTDNYPVSRLTDGSKTVVSPCAIIGYNNKYIGYYETKFANLQKINKVILYYSRDEANLRPKDLAVDVLQENGIWKRVAELHNIVYDATEPLRITFPEIEGKKLRITANAKRVSEENPNTILNFRLTEAEAFYDPSVTKYTEVQSDKNAAYHIQLPDAELKNLLLKRPVTTSNLDPFYTENYPASRLTDGDKSIISPCAIIGFNSQRICYYEIEFAGLQTFNKVLLHYSRDEANLRPKDLAVDVLQENGVWKRVAELHNIVYDATEPLRLMFPEIQGKKLRITANANRIMEENPNTILNFRLTEAEAFYDPTVTEYTGVASDKNKAYQIKIPDAIIQNVLSGGTVTTSKVEEFYINNYPASNLIDGQKFGDVPCAIINYKMNGKGYFEIAPKKPEKINTVRIYYSTFEPEMRPIDLALDIQDSAGVWHRVAELHNMNYVDLLTDNTVLNLKFKTMVASKIRVTANRKRNKSYNFRLTEIEAGFDPTVTREQYSPIQKLDDNKYRIPTPEEEAEEENAADNQNDTLNNTQPTTAKYNSSDKKLAADRVEMTTFGFLLLCLGILHVVIIGGVLLYFFYIRKIVNRTKTHS